jgi:hypothetical protein
MRLQVGVVVTACVDGGDVDVGVVLVESLDHPLHFDRQLALDRNGKEQVDLSGCLRGARRKCHCEEPSEEATSVTWGPRRLIGIASPPHPRGSQ